MLSKHLPASIISAALLFAGTQISKAGLVQQLFYDGITGTAVIMVTTNAIYPDGPTAAQNIESVPASANQFTTTVGAPGAADFGSLLRGYIEAPQNGNYKFYIRSDDASELWLSPDLNPANKVRIAQETGCCNGWIENGMQSSTNTITLVRGQKYYFEAIYKEGGGGDYMQVGWKLPDGRLQQPMPIHNVAPFQVIYAPGVPGGNTTSTIPVIVSGPVDTTLDEARNGEIFVNVNAAQPTTFQWYRGGSPLAGENLSYLAFTNVQVALNNTTYFVIVSNSFGSVTSSVATLTVTADTTRPTAVSAFTQGNPNGFVLRYSESVSETTATNLSNYALNNSISGPIAITSATLLPDRQSVRFVTANLNGAGGVTLTINGVQDLAAAPNTILPATQVVVIRADGSIKRSQYIDPGINAAMASFTNHIKFQNDTPDIVDYVTLPEGPLDIRENYGTALRGYVTAPETGDYIFYISADDNAILFLSTDETPANKTRIAFEPQWNGYRNFLGTARRPAQENISVPIALSAGTRYYIEALATEGGGGDNLSVGWKRPSMNPPAVNGDVEVIPGGYLTPYQPNYASGPVIITQQPASVTVLQSSPANFSVSVNGTPPYTFQWYRDNNPISGANGTSHTTTPVTLADNGATFFVVVGNSFSSLTSSVATLTVNSDGIPPTISGVQDTEGARTIIVRFSELMSQTTATNAGNYTLSGGVGVTAAVLDASGSNVVLTTGTQAEGVSYTLTVSGVRDVAGNTIAASSTANFTSFVFTPAFVTQRRYNGDGAVTVASLRADPEFPDRPDAVTYPTLIEEPGSNDGANFGVKISGYIVADPGAYNFFMSADDGAETWLSTDDQPANLVLIATEPVWNGARQYLVTSRRNGGAPENRSTTLFPSGINLAGGQKYFFESLMKEGGGGDNLSVAWQLPGGPEPANGSLPIGGLNIGNYYDPIGVSLSISQHPTNRTRFANQTTTFTVVSGVTNPAAPGRVFIQWQSSNGGAFTNIPGAQTEGATSSSFTTPFLTLADNGATYRALVFSPGAGATSQVATLTVQQDLVPPTMVGGRASKTFDSLTISFSEPIDPASVQLSDFTVNNGLTLTGATVDSTGTNIVLTTSTQPEGTNYTITVSTVADLAGNNIVAGSTINLRSAIFQRGFAERRRFDGVTGGIAGLTGDPRYAANNPTIRSSVSLIEKPTDECDNCGTLILGYIIPDDNFGGSYNFFMSADDPGQFWLSTDGTPANRVLLASEPTWNGVRDYIGSTRRTAGAEENRSTTLFPAGIPLVAGQRYYFEALEVEGGGGDNLSVAWQLPGGAVPANGSLPIGGTNIGVYMDLNASTVAITQQPTNTSVLQNRPVTFAVTAVGSSDVGTAVSYQWQRDSGGGVFTNIPGATASSYTLAVATTADNNAVFRATASVIGATTTSSNAILTIISDTVAPALVSAYRSCLLSNTVFVLFDEWVSAASANTAGFYTIPGTTVTSAVLNGTRQVLLTTSSDISGGTLTVNGVQDQAGNPLNGGSIPINIDVRVQDPSTNGMLVFEAENYDRNIAQGGSFWTFGNDRAGFSGVGFMEATPNSGRNVGPPGYLTDSPRLDYCVNITQTGTFHVWIRGSARTTGGNSDSVHAGYDELLIPSAQVISPGLDTLNWVWTKANAAIAFVNITNAGPHNINVWMREDGLMVDKILLTLDAGFVPQGVNGGLGPNESTRGAVVVEPRITSIVYAGGNVTVVWTGGGNLQSSINVIGTYGDISGATSGTHTEPATGPAKYYRVRR